MSDDEFWKLIALIDRDFGYLADERFDPLDLLPPLVTALGTDRIDLVDLRRAGALLRLRVARDGA
jgi:hypothetical protein